MNAINEKNVQKVLDFIKDFQRQEGKSPSFRQIQKGCGFPTLSTAQKYVALLQKRNLIDKNEQGRIVIPQNLSIGPSNVAPVVGNIACGLPILAEENIEGTFQLPTQIFGNQKLMILHACGDSMIGVGINDGDLIVAEICNTAENGDIVVALLGDSATVKRFYKKRNHFVLHAENPKYEDIITKELVIQGVVKHVIHSF